MDAGSRRQEATARFDFTLGLSWTAATFVTSLLEVLARLWKFTVLLKD